MAGAWAMDEEDDEAGAWMEEDWLVPTSLERRRGEWQEGPLRYDWNEPRWCEIEFAHNDVLLRCLLRRPRRPRAGPLPLLLYLHSASYNPYDDLFPEGDAWLDDACAEDPMLVLCPRCPDDYYWLLRGNSWKEVGGEWVTDRNGFCFWVASAAEEMVTALVALLRHVVHDDAAAPVSADPRRIFLSGASMGGLGCWDLAARHPRLFRALAPVASELPRWRGCQEAWTTWATQRLTGLPIWAFHGPDDLCCPFQDVARLVRRLGPPAGLTTYRGRRKGQSVHNSAGQVAFVEHGAELVAWLLRQRPGEVQ